MEVPQKEREESRIFALCCRVPIRRYSVFEGLTVRRFDVSQEQTASRVEERIERLVDESELENEIYSWVSSAYR